MDNQKKLTVKQWVWGTSILWIPILIWIAVFIKENVFHNYEGLLVKEDPPAQEYKLSADEFTKELQRIEAARMLDAIEDDRRAINRYRKYKD